MSPLVAWLRSAIHPPRLLPIIATPPSTPLLFRYYAIAARGLLALEYGSLLDFVAHFHFLFFIFSFLVLV